MQRDQRFAIPLQVIARAAAFDADSAIGERNPSTYQLPTADPLGQLFEQSDIRRRFEHQFQRATTRQPEAMRFISRHAVAQHARHRADKLTRRCPANQIILNTSTRD